jgi:hypothetical protein
MTNAQDMRKVAARMVAISGQTKDAEWAAHLALRASDLLSQAEQVEAEEKQK